MKKYLIVIFLIALGLRIYSLDNRPYGFHVDEAKVGWVAANLIKTGRDDQGKLWPAYYDSFGDQRPTGIFYLAMPFIYLSGNTVAAVRMGSALLGALTVLPLYFLTKEIFNKNTMAAAGAAGLLAVNPWHIVVSRATSEVVVSVFLGLWALFFLIIYFRSNRFLLGVISIFFILLSFGFYHTVRILAPAYFLLMTLYFWPIIKNKSGAVVVVGVVGFCSLLLMMQPQARGRMSQVTILHDAKVDQELRDRPREEGPGKVLVARSFHNKVVVYGSRILEEYWRYFDLSLLLGGAGARPVRYTVPGAGLLTGMSLILILMAMMGYFKNKNILLTLGLLLLSPIPAAVTNEDTPNIHRSLWMLPFWLMLAGAGISVLTDNFRKYRIAVLTGIIVLELVSLTYFWHMYGRHAQWSLSAYFRDGGNVELSFKIKEIQNKYNYIYLPNYPDELLPWLGFLNREDPTSFKQDREGRIGSLVFTKEHCPSEKILQQRINNQNSVVVDGEGCKPDMIKMKELGYTTSESVYRPDGSPPYMLWY